MPFNTVDSNQKANTILTNGRIINKNAAGGYYVEYEGKTYYISKDQALLSFKDKKDLTKDITYWPQHQVDYYKKIYTESETKRKELKAEDGLLKGIKKVTQKMYNEALNGAKKIEEITDSYRKNLAFKCEKKLNGIKKALRLNSARFISECYRGFDAALKGGEWNNNLAVSQQVAKKLS